MESRSNPRLSPVAGWALAMLLTVFAVAPLTYPGFFQAESGFLPAFRAAGLEPTWFRPADVLRDDGTLPYLLVRPFFHLSGSGIVAVKWGYAAAALLGAWGIYAWLRRWLGSGGAVLAAAVYTYLPWHLAVIYRRGAYARPGCGPPGPGCCGPSTAWARGAGAASWLRPPWACRRWCWPSDRNRAWQ